MALHAGLGKELLPHAHLLEMRIRAPRPDGHLDDLFLHVDEAGIGDHLFGVGGLEEGFAAEVAEFVEAVWC